MKYFLPEKTLPGVAAKFLSSHPSELVSNQKRLPLAEVAGTLGAVK
jgi:hypothetical protein